MFYLLLFIFGFIAGFCAHRGGVCLVGATHELVTQKRSRLFFFIFAAMSVAFAIVMLAAFFLPMKVHFAQTIGIGPAVLSGALLYGVGAAMNGGCALGTLNKLFSGHLVFIGSLAGLALGFTAFLLLLDSNLISAPPMIMGEDMTLAGFSFLLLAVFFSFSFWLGRSGSRDGATLKSYLNNFLHAPLAGNFIAIILLGAASGALYLMVGHGWDYSRLMMSGLSSLVFAKPPGAAFLFVLLATGGLFAGMLTASLMSGKFEMQTPKALPLLGKIAAGSLMGFGAGFLAGGNDTLLLYGVPGAALHAPVALLLIVFSIWLMLFFHLRRAG